MAADRATLETWIAETQRNQRRLRRGLLPATVAAAALTFWSRPVGGGALLLVALVALFGYWITTSHIADWEARIQELGRPKPVGRAVRRR